MQARQLSVPAGSAMQPCADVFLLTLHLASELLLYPDGDACQFRVESWCRLAGTMAPMP